MMTKIRLSVLVALLCVTSAQAREATLTSFDQFASDDDSAKVSSSPINEALRFHLEKIVQPEGPADFQVVDARFYAVEQGHSSSPCLAASYSPTWWLPGEVEVRRAAQYETMASIACEFGIPPNLLDAVIAQESGYKSWAISSAGAMGMMQIMPGTARVLGLAFPFEPIANMRAGARYLRQQIDRFGRVDLALAAYNAGPERRSLRAGYIPAIPETRSYVRTITTNWARLAAREPEIVTAVDCR